MSGFKVLYPVFDPAIPPKISRFIVRFLSYRVSIVYSCPWILRYAGLASSK